jgi:hypothetical protein
LIKELVFCGLFLSFWSGVERGVTKYQFPILILTVLYLSASVLLCHRVHRVQHTPRNRGSGVNPFLWKTIEACEQSEIPGCVRYEHFTSMGDVQVVSMHMWCQKSSELLEIRDDVDGVDFCHDKPVYVYCDHLILIDLLVFDFFLRSARND